MDDAARGDLQPALSDEAREPALAEGPFQAQLVVGLDRPMGRIACGKHLAEPSAARPAPLANSATERPERGQREVARWMPCSMSDSRSSFDSVHAASNAVRGGEVTAMPSARLTMSHSGRSQLRTMRTPGIGSMRLPSAMTTQTSGIRGVLRSSHTMPAVGKHTTPPVTAQAIAIRCSSAVGPACADQHSLADESQASSAFECVDRSAARCPMPPAVPSL